MAFPYERCDIQLVFLLISEEDYDQFCLAYMFTYRDFEMGTLGLAWTGDLKNAGGVCEKNGVSGV
jgi:disintegrin and metalloproteinase domain-containing protein 10